VDAGEPLVRARHLQLWLDLVERSEAPYAERFAQRLPAQVREVIRAAAPVAWLPAGLHAELADLLLAAWGPRRAHQYYRDAFPKSLEGPLFGPLVRTGVAVLGLSPAAFLRWAGKGWNLSMRNAGTFEGEVVERGRGRLSILELAPVLAASRPWVESIPSSIYGVYDLTRTTGVVRVLESNEAGRRFVFELEWDAR
jgi:hypothetical protein